MTMTLQQFITWRKAHDYCAMVRTRAQMDALTGKGQKNRDGKIFVHETTDYAPVVWDSQKDNNRGATGYYADNYQDELICWCIIKIAPANRKHNREALYAPVTYSSGYEGVTIHVDNAGSLDDAKRWGEQLAEREAEELREYHAKDQAEQRISEERAELMTNEEYSNFFGEMKPAPDDSYEYKVCQNCIIALDNDDYSGMEDDEVIATCEGLLSLYAKHAQVIADGAEYGFCNNSCECCDGLPGNRFRVICIGA